MPPNAKNSVDPGPVAAQLAEALEKRGTEYALGGAIALGYWGRPRGTLDVDLTLFLAKDKPSEVVWELQEIGCTVGAASAVASILEHGFCTALFDSVKVDVFVPLIPFYDVAKARRKRKLLGNQPVMVWDAETLAVFKMMFFRPRDWVDLLDIMTQQGADFDRGWVRDRLLDIYGSRDPRVAKWDELVLENQA
ncbi:MAG TPA: hypothetical protein VGI40_11850 [Pirellulaceae bacterium]|jgi:hypothetical protein